MRHHRWLIALACAGLAALSVRGENCALLPGERAAWRARLAAAQAAASAEAKLLALAFDPAEPAVKVEVDSGSPPQPHSRLRPLSELERVTNGPHGMILGVDARGLADGVAVVRFRDGPPPMRLTLRVAGMTDHEVRSLTLKSGAVWLRAGPVRAAATVKYFDKHGRPQQTDTGAAYTVTTRRLPTDFLVVEVRRGAGAKLGKTVTLSWSSEAEPTWERLLQGIE